MCPDVNFNAKIHKKFGSYDGFLTQFMNHSESTKIKLITMIKQGKALLSNPTTLPTRVKKQTNSGPIETQTHLYEEVIIESEARRRAIIMESIAINRDWVNNKACSLPHNV